MLTVQKQILSSLLLLILQAPVQAEDALSRGIELYNRKRFAEALQIFSGLKPGTESDSKRFYYCALCYLQMGQTEKARELFQRIEANFKGSEAAQLSHAFLLQTIPRASTLPPNGRAVAAAASSTTASLPSDSPEFSIPFRRTSKGQMAVQGDLQGRSMEMIFDTGAEECLFGRNQVETANLSDADRQRMPPLNTVSGPVPVYKVNASIKLGSLKRTLPIMVQDAVMDTPILGQPFFNGYDCSVDGQAALMRFHKSGLRSNFKVDSFAVPFRDDGDKMIVTARFNGRNVDMCFDSGAFGVCLSKDQAERMRIKIGDTPPTNTKGPNGSYVNSWDMFADITLGDIRKEHFPIRVIDCTTSYPLLGLNFFGDRIYKIDREKKEIRFAR